MIPAPDTSPRLAVLRFPPVGEVPEEEWLTSTEIPPATFLAHLDAIRHLGWEPIEADTFVAGLDDPEVLPERAVLLTFDGGYRSLLTEALEYLRKKRWPAVAFVPTGLVGGEAALETGDEKVRELCTWGELLTLHSQGVSIQSQGVSHRLFRRLDAPEVESEIHAAKRTIEEKLGSSVTLFAYPGGDPGPDARQAEQILKLSGYCAAFVAGGGVASAPPDRPYRIPRIEVGLSTDLARLLPPKGG